MEGPQRYRLRGPGGPGPFVFDDEVAVFNPVTWDTHLLDASAAAVLEALARGPATPADIERLLSGHRAAEGADAAQLAQALVDQLASAGLIEAEPVDPTR